MTEPSKPVPAGADAPLARLGRRDVISAFAAMVRARPDAVAAIEDGVAQVTFAELDRKARSLAERLVLAGAGHGAIVALAATRSIDALVAIVAIAMSGAAYLPLDPSYPDAQLGAMLDDARPVVVLASAGMRSRLGGDVPTQALEEALRGDDSAWQPPLPQPGDPLYVMFTSGSTGRPKGVVVPHRAVHRLVVGQDYCALGPGEVVLHLAPLAFDASTFEIWGALLNGGTLAIVASDHPSVDDIAAAITGQGVTTAWLTAGLFHLMVDTRIEALRGLRQLLAGGDVLSPDHVRRFLAAAPDCRLINGYGPTENTTFTCCATLSAEPWLCTSAPIGRPINGTSVWIVDDHLQPVTTGEPGQLVAGGEGLAIGYLGAEELTAERFVHAPAPIDARVYLTGDLVRELPDGQIEFRGRIDRQVKIDGKRIEPGEIEQALRACQGVSDAAVVVETSASGVKRLVGFVAVDRPDAAARDAVAAEAGGIIRERLAEHLWPARIVALASLPITPNGKLDRAALTALGQGGQAQPATEGLEARIAALWCEVLGLDHVAPGQTFFELGGRSLQLMRVHAALQDQVGASIPVTELFAHPTVSGLAAWLEGRAERAGAPAHKAAAAHSGAIAIVGMTGRFPGAASVEEFWANQKAGTVSITQFAEAELKDSFDPATRADPAFVRARGVLANPGDFDADLFAMRPKEAQLTDPQHRLFLEIALEALERAGLDPQRYAGQVGVFAGSSMPTYLIGHILGGTEAAMDFASTYQLDGMDRLVGSLPDALATRVAYKLGLNGPAITVLSACSTSAVAVVQACQSLQLGHCDAALAGGVSITFPQERGYLYLDGGMGSRDGTCRPLDAEASGTVFGSGAGVVVLKRLEDALADGDHIYATIRGFGINNDGSGKGSLTAPSAKGQADAIRAAQTNAGVDPASIGYVELHGTATPLGDPIEFSGLVQAFGADCPPATCALGSAKANIGHLDVAAGVTGLIKAALCLHEEVIPPLANFTRPNPHIAMEGSAFRVEQALAAWPRGDAPRRAGVSAFGVGGTNVHIVLEEAPEQPRQQFEQSLQILPLSAKTPEALGALAGALADHLERHPDLELADVALSLHDGRMARAERAAVVVQNHEQAIERLHQLPKRGLRGTARAGRPIVFMFPGQGSQYPGMGASLYRDEPVYRHWIDAGADRLGTRLGHDLRHLLYDLPDAGEDTPHPIRATVNAQPALFVTQHALAQLWISRGIVPSAMIGHSVGELVAACVSGVLTFDDALDLVARRAELMQSAPAGAMLAVRAPEADLAPLLGPDLDLAAVNAPALCVAAGPFGAIEGLEARLAAAEIECRRLHTSHAFHSAMMDPVVDQLADLATGMAFAAPRIPYVSGVTGTWARGEADGNGAYWARHCREPVRFAAALTAVVRGEPPMLIEVGPGRALSTFANQGLAREDFLAALSSMPDFAEAGRDREQFYETAARLWTLGAEPDWSDLYGPDARKVPLPAYQFQRKTFWIEPPARSGPADPAILQPVPAIAAPVFVQESVNPVMTSPAPAAASEPRGPRLSAEIAAVLEDLSGNEITPADWDAPFIELGFDSLSLGQVATRVQRDYGVKVTFRQLMADLSTVSALTAHLDQVLPPETAPAVSFPEPPIAAPSAAQPAPFVTQATPPVAADGLAAAFQVQLSAMQGVIDRQLEVLRGLGGAPAAPAVPVVQPVVVSAKAAPVPVAAVTADAAEPAPSRFKPFVPSAQDDSSITPEQRRFIANLTERYCARMAGSKAQTQAHRPYFADPRSASGFRSEWKEMVFPVVAARSKGSQIWDVDGNVYVDLVNGYGQTAFGHAPDFVAEAVAHQLAEGFAIGPQTPMAGIVAQQVSRMIGLERVTFCNTGSEAVMAAMRLARCVTGREKVVVFANDYHGQFDEVLVKPGGKASFGRAFPLAPGIPYDSVANMVVLPYGSADALKWIADNAEDVAAVVVEPVQSRHPDLLPFDFLRDLRALATQEDFALVFDEVVTGFRTHPGGMQAVLGIKADMATYGKVVGGGMPIGILAGSARFLDALDGGTWQFGDDSFPEVAPTFFAGTFVRHPLVMAACKAVLDHLEAQGPALQERLAARNAGLVERLNALFAAKGVPSTIHSYSSWFMLDVANTHRLGGLFQMLMRLRGVHVLDGYPCFLTTAHSDADIDHIVESAAAAIDELQAVGILVGDQPPAAVATGPRTVPLTEPQLEVLLAAQMSAEASCAFNESMSLRFDGLVDPTTLEGAINAFVVRHDAMRATVTPGEPKLSIAPKVEIALAVETGDEAALAAILREEAETPFDLYAGPLLRTRLIQVDGLRSVLVVTAHHMVFDGWTANVFAREVAELYRARTSGTQPALDPVLSYADYAASRADTGALSDDDAAYWQAMFAEAVEPLALPSDRPRPQAKTFRGASVTTLIDAETTRAVRQAGAKLGCTLFATLFGALQVTLGRLAQQDDVVLVCPTAGQALVEDQVLAGHCVNLLPLRARFSSKDALGSHLKAVKDMALEAFAHQESTYGSIVRSLRLPRDPNRTPLSDVQFNLERLEDGIDFGGVTATLQANPKAAVNFDLFFNVVDSAAGLRIDIDYATDLYDEETVLRWTGNLRQVLAALVADPAVAIGAIDLIGAEEQAWLDARNPADPTLPEFCSVVSEFVAAAGAYPDHIALTADGRSCTYAELDRRTSRMAHALIAQGVGKGDTVALLAGRSIEAVEMILAVLKSGAAYVPLDPSYPPARQDHVLRDCGAKLVLAGP
ncbi:MAG: amino acid adenylation domain-containing protein, partial [Sphingomonadales bacterium]|nr:amino acid adenylation domain-containing protein [Sphingomonadales bacterium]